MTSTELKALIESKHRPDLALRPGMVWQVWEDGELTLQKSGELLWQRNLHCIAPGIVQLNKSLMPVQEREHGYAFIENEEVGKEIRKAMLDFVAQMI
jgi:hypothetical protein